MWHLLCLSKTLKYTIMKKISLIIISSLFLLPVVAQEQKEKQEEEKTKFSKWSVSVDVGLNAFDGDIMATPYNWHQNVRGGFTPGVIVDYTFNPIVSLGLMYKYLPLSADNRYQMYPRSGGQVTDIGDFTSKYHLIAPSLSVNMINVISKTVETKWGFWVSAGIGFGIFSSDMQTCNILTDPVTGLRSEDWTQHPTLKGVSLSIPIGGHLEYNFTKNLAAGLNVQYISNNRDDIEGLKDKGRFTLAGVTNDYISSASVNVRWKFCAQKNPHTRNINWATYRPNEALLLAQALKDDIDKLKGDVGDLGKRVDDLDARVGDIEKLLSDEGPDDDGDGVPNHRDREPNTPANMPVNFWGVSMAPKAYSSIPFIFFDHDQTTLDDNAHETIYLVSELLKANPAVLVEVRGFCDYTGNDPYNQELSKRRAERAKKELVDVYGIDAKRIGTNGNGRIIEPRKKYRPNRRVEFHFSE